MLPLRWQGLWPFSHRSTSASATQVSRLPSTIAGVPCCLRANTACRFQNREVGYDETRAVEVRPTETTTINLVPQTALNVTANEAAEVLVDGERTGETPFDGRIPYGAHTITIRTAGGERQFQIEATMKPVQLEVDFSKP